jgi:glycosyltransferase involved in cell wall biosynthesis
MKLSIVVPIYNEEARISDTIKAAEAAVAEAGLDAEILVVDDGSTDGSAEAAEAASNGLPVRVLRQANAGRYLARKKGLEAAEGDYILFLDSRVRLLPGSLDFIRERVEAGEDVWNAHVIIATNGKPYGAFWNVLTELVFSDYFAEPRTTSFDAESFERFPKGTTCFLAPRDRLLAAFGAFTSRYDDIRMANDDTPIIRRLAEEGSIHISPRFSCLYQPRKSLNGFLRHAYHRGLVFLDGHARRESGFFPLVVAFYPLSAASLVVVLRRPAAAPALALAVSLAAGVVAAAKGRSRRETLSFATLAPVYGLAHGAGMWRGLAYLVGTRLRV